MTDAQEGNQDLRVSARTARLTAGSSDGDDGVGSDGPPWTFSGVAVAAGDILHLDDGTPVLVTGEELKKAAETQAGEPLSVDHPEDDNGRPEYPPPTDETVGNVPKAGYVDEVDGVGYEATTHDEDIAKGVQADTYDVSVHPVFELGEMDEETGAYKAKNIKFRDLSVVSKGDSPNNTAEWGPNHALASWTEQADVGAELTALHDEDDQGVRALVKKLGVELGILTTSDFRGFVDMDDQTTTGETVTVDEAVFDDAAWVSVLHLEGDEFPEIGPGLGPAIGTGEVHDAGESATDEVVELDTPLDEDVRVYNVLHFATEGGEVSEPITTSDGAYFIDDAFVGVAPEDVPVEEEATASASSSDESAESDTRSTESEMSDTEDNEETEETEEAEETDEEESNVIEVDIGDHDSFEDFLETRIDEKVEQATADATKEDKVEEIIAESDDYDEDDREELLGSADALVDDVHEQVTGAGGNQFPGAVGEPAEITAGAGADDAGDDELDEYGTGVADH